MVLFDCQVDGCTLRLYQTCQGEYVSMHEIELDGAERKICRDCVDNLRTGGKPEKLKKVVHSTMYRTA